MNGGGGDAAHVVARLTGAGEELSANVDGGELAVDRVDAVRGSLQQVELGGGRQWAGGGLGGQVSVGPPTGSTVPPDPHQDDARVYEGPATKVTPTGVTQGGDVGVSVARGGGAAHNPCPDGLLQAAPRAAAVVLAYASAFMAAQVIRGQLATACRGEAERQEKEGADANPCRLVAAAAAHGGASSAAKES